MTDTRCTTCGRPESAPEHHPDVIAMDGGEREGLARVIRDANAADVLGAETLDGPGWDGLVGSVEDWLPEADAALAWFAAQPRPDGDLRERVAADFDALLPVLAIAGEEAAPVVIRDASEFRIWTLTEDEDGDWWGWSWREEGEDWAPVRADFLRYPVTILHAPIAALGLTVADEGRAEA